MRPLHKKQPAPVTLYAAEVGILLGIWAMPLERRICPKKRVVRFTSPFVDREAIHEQNRAIGAIIRNYRRERRLTQRGLAGVLGTTEWTIQEWEAGRDRPVRFRS